MDMSTSNDDLRCKNNKNSGNNSKPRKLQKWDDCSLLADRISKLPDAVIGDILSFLPTKEAVATSVLSRRWRRVFTWVARLNFDDSPISHCVNHTHMVGSFPNFKMFVDKVLQLCHSNTIASYRLHFAKANLAHLLNGDFTHLCKDGCYPEMEPMHLNAWLCFPLTRGIKELDICVHVRKPDKLPSAIFGCQTLEVLKLNVVNLDIELPSSFCLPNLKEFYLLSPVIPGGDFVTSLLSSFPSLVHLALLGNMNSRDPVVISSQFLRILKLSIYNIAADHQRTKIVLDVPNLEYLWYGDTFALHYSIGNMNAVAEAIIDIENSSPEAVVTFAKSLSNVQRLYLFSGSMKGLSGSESKLGLPVFCYLKHLTLVCFGYSIWNKVLMELLNCTPVLETLSFPGGIRLTCIEYDLPYIEESQQDLKSWNRTQTIPSCLLLHLKRITVKKFCWTEREIEMIKYFLRSSLVLEELEVTSAERVKFSNTLETLPRASKRCSIKVDYHNTGTL